MPSSQPMPLSATRLEDLVRQLNYIIKDIYSLMDVALGYDNKGQIISLNRGGLGADVSAYNGVLKIVSGEAGQIQFTDTGLTFLRDDGTFASISAPGVNPWRIGSGVPDGSLGNVGDYYLDLASGDLYYKSGVSTWDKKTTFFLQYYAS